MQEILLVAEAWNLVKVNFLLGLTVLLFTGILYAYR